MSNKLELRNINISSFAGISKKAPIVLQLPAGERFVKLEGDQGTKKTSTIEALKGLLSSNLVPNAINTEDKDKKGQVEFVGKDGKLYRAKITKTTFVLENIVTDDEGKILLDDKDKERTRTENKPSTLIRKLVGPLGINPLELKTMKPGEIIDWLKDYFSVNTDDLKVKEKKLTGDYKSAYDKRKSEKKELKKITTIINASIYIKDKSKWETEFKELDREVEVTTNIAAKKEDAEAYIRKETELQGVKETLLKTTTEISATEIEIERLTKILAVRKEEKDKLDLQQKDLETFIDNNKTIKEEQTKLDAELKKIQDLKMSKALFDIDVKKLDDKKIIEDNITQYNKDITTAEEAIALHVKSFTPDIPGFEVVIGNGVTEEPEETEKVEGEEAAAPVVKKEEGVYYNDQPVGHLCESELWEMCLLIWDAFDVNIVFIENITNLGSNAVERLNWFVERGGYVFATEMDRAEKNIKVSINTKIV